MRKLFVVAALALAAACGDSTSPSSVSGTYNLQTVNGAALPYVFQADNPKRELISEQLVLSANGTFTFNDVIRTTPTGGAPTTMPTTDSGTFTLTGNSIVFTFGGTSSIAGSVSGSTLTIIDTGVTAVYSKQ